MIAWFLGILRQWWAAYCAAAAERGCAHDPYTRCPLCGGREPADW